jgi:hypothetical protein
MARPSLIVLVRIPDRLVFVTKGIKQEMCAQNPDILDAMRQYSVAFDIRHILGVGVEDHPTMCFERD